MPRLYFKRDKTKLYFAKYKRNIVSEISFYRITTFSCTHGRRREINRTRSAADKKRAPMKMQVKSGQTGEFLETKRAEKLKLSSSPSHPMHCGRGNHR